MQKNVNCKFNDSRAWCTNEDMPRSIFGIGARCCCEFMGKKCDKVSPLERPKPPKRFFS